MWSERLQFLNRFVLEMDLTSWPARQAIQLVFNQHPNRIVIVKWLLLWQHAGTAVTVDHCLHCKHRGIPKDYSVAQNYAIAHDDAVSHDDAIAHDDSVSQKDAATKKCPITHHDAGTLEDAVAHNYAVTHDDAVTNNDPVGQHSAIGKNDAVAHDDAEHVVGLIFRNDADACRILMSEETSLRPREGLPCDCRMRIGRGSCGKERLVLFGRGTEIRAHHLG